MFEKSDKWEVKYPQGLTMTLKHQQMAPQIVTPLLRTQQNSDYRGPSVQTQKLNQNFSDAATDLIYKPMKPNIRPIQQHTPFITTIGQELS